ncbi:MAG: ribonuclease III [Woeseiaceae bacterium]|nr:ribonuclease III [Woeseiaceae bacterium]MDX2608654.1 ribonuclease III [Woeseiaceae bacterium]
MANKAETWLNKALDYQFNDARLLEQALTHRSAPGDNNERLEFLGDAVLDFAISEVVFRAFPMAPEGDLSRLRASLVKDTSLAALAADMGLGEHLILGSGERKTGGHRRESILADALEAIFGAVYLDAGFDAAAKVIETTFGDRLQNFPSIDSLRDPKTRLQEWLQARQMGLPEYELTEVTGKAHRQTFEVSCSVSGASSQTRGIGTTRRKAEQESAEKMLLKLTGDSDS